MHESDRNRLLKEQRALLLAASDMEQAAAAAIALDNESKDVRLMRALETAIAVCYARPFTQSSLLRLEAGEFRPRDPELAGVHDYLLELRDKVHAHTDRQSGRDATIEIQTPATVTFSAGEGAVASTQKLSWREEWLPLPREAIPAALQLFEGQRDYMRARALIVRAELEKTVSTIEPRQP